MGSKQSINTKIRQLGKTRMTTFLLTGIDIDGEVMSRKERRRVAREYLKTAHLIERLTHDGE